MYRDAPAPPDPDSVFPSRAAAWDYVRHILDLVFSLFAAPAALARLGGVSLQYQAHMRFWLRPAERLARLLLLAEAAEIAPLKRRPAKPARRVFPRPDDLSDPRSETWRVSFPVLRASCKRGSGAKGYVTPNISPLRLAARFEALVRIALDPTPYARRLARRLERRPNPRAVRALLAGVRTEGAPLMRVVEMARPLLSAIPLRFSSA